MKTQFASLCYNDTTRFKLWGKALSDALTEVGFLKTTDTGQVDWTGTITVPGANTFGYYEIRKFNDSLSATLPMFMKIEFGTAGSSTSPAIAVTVGTASDGAGNITGRGIARQILRTNSGNSTNLFDTYVAAGDDWVTIAMWANSVGSIYPLALYVTRTRDELGVATDDGIQIVMNATSLGFTQIIPKKGSMIPAVALNGPLCAAPRAGTGSYGDNVGVFPIFYYLGYPANPDMTGVGYFVNDLPGGGTVLTLTINGITHDYVTSGASNTTLLNANSNSGSMAVRWE